MAKIIVRRTEVMLVDRARQYSILIDGEKSASLSHGEEVELDVTPGKHTVQMKIDWCTSPMLDVEVIAGEEVRLACGPNASPLLTLVYISLWRGKYIWLREINGTPTTTKQS